MSEETTYLFVTTGGFTEDPNRRKVENNQVLGRGSGVNAEEALEDFRHSNRWLLGYSFHDVVGYPIDSSKVKINNTVEGD